MTQDIKSEFRYRNLVYITPLVEFAITPDMKEMILDKVDMTSDLSAQDAEALVLARDSQFQDGEFNKFEAIEIIEEMSEIERAYGDVKATAVCGAAGLSEFTDRKNVSASLSRLSYAANNGLAGAAYPLAGWYADRVAFHDLNMFEDLEMPSKDFIFKPKEKQPIIPFPKTNEECFEQAFKWALFGASNKIYECDEILKTLEIPLENDFIPRHFDMLEEAIAADSIAAKRILGVHLLLPDESPEKHARGIKLFRDIVRDKSPKDFFALSLALKDTIGELPDSTPEEAFEWCRKAAEGGLPEAMRAMGIFYEKGFGVKKNFEIAFDWVVKAAEAGDGISQTLLGTTLYDHATTPKEAREAVHWIREAAENSDIPEAWAKLSEAYKTGFGLYVNKKKSADCIKRAKKLGYVPHEDSSETDAPAT